MAPPSKVEWRLGAVLVGALVLWGTDTLHGVSPGWVGLAAGLICLIPGLGLVPPKALSERIDTNSLFYVAAVLGLGATIAHSGLADILGQWTLAAIPFGGSAFWDFSKLAVISTVLAMVVTNPGVPAVMSPLAEGLSGATGLPLKAVLMTQVLGFSNVVLPYQAAPVLVAMQMGGVPLREGAKATLMLTGIGVVLLIPLTFVWWRWIGLI